MKNSSRNGFARWASAAPMLAAFGVMASPAMAIEGVYNTGRSEVETGETSTIDIKFHSCADDAKRVCGTIVGIHEPDGPSGRDMMPDGSPIIGFTMIRDLVHEGNGEYRKGDINAIDESLKKEKMIWYGVKIDDAGNGKLKIKGCLGFICPRTMYWERVDG